MSIKKVKPWGEGQGDYVIIDEADYNPEKHAIYNPKAKPEADKPTPAKAQAKSAK